MMQAPWNGPCHVPLPSLPVLVFLSAVQLAVFLSASEPVADWLFVPEYDLPGRAANHPGPREPHPRGEHPPVAIDSAPLRFHGELPTQRLLNLLPATAVPRESFTVEAWLCHHVHQPVGALLAVKSKRPGGPVPWALGFHAWESSFRMQGLDGTEVYLQRKMPKWGGFKERWVHLVATYDGHDVRLYVNGEQVASGHMHHDQLLWPEDTEFEMAAFMEREPFMQWANLVNQVRLYDIALSAAEVRQRFAQLQLPIVEGRVYPQLFHYTAGPCLNHATQEGVSVVWETDRPARGTLSWGPTAELGQSLAFDQASRLQEATITGLDANTPYFYRIRSITEDGQSIDSGLLTFKTAVLPGQPFRFAVIGDTESRPHVNDRLCKLIWEERPNFLVNLGDLTDGGTKPHRYEWTHEYFAGMTQLTSRLPVFAVPGNGEGDLHWYKHYHRYPSPEGYYQFRYGDAAFFMLDSNQREQEFAPGGQQYEWLKKQLQQCDAPWKFVCHHHATYTGEEDDYGDSWKGASTFGDPAVRRIVPLYEEFGVDIVMFGHLHLYERSLPMKAGQVDFRAGTIHLLAGGGGGNLEDFAPTPAFFSAKTHRGHHYVMFELQGNTLQMRMHDTSGAIRDRFSVEKTNHGLRTIAVAAESDAAQNSAR